VGLAGLALLAVAFVLRRETLTPLGSVVCAAAALVLVSWTAMGVGTSRRRAREAMERERRAEQEQARKDAEEAARRAVRAVNARRTTSHGGATIAVRRRSSNGQAE
jgi:20S proteasome alpha/beta subunit